jgi:hypothetical protein
MFACLGAMKLASAHRLLRGQRERLSDVVGGAAEFRRRRLPSIRCAPPHFTMPTFFSSQQ